MKTVIAILLVIGLTFPAPASAAPGVINFEGRSDGWSL